MKRVHICATVLLAIAICAGCIQEEPAGGGGTPVETTNDTAQAAPLDVNQVAFGIEGMTWATACVNAVNTALAGVPGVSEAVVDFDSKTVVITKSDEYSDKAIVDAVAGAGDFIATKQ